VKRERVAHRRSQRPKVKDTYDKALSLVLLLLDPAHYPTEGGSRARQVPPETVCWSEVGPAGCGRTSAACHPAIRGWLAVEGAGPLEGGGAASDKHTVSGNAPALDGPLLPRSFALLREVWVSAWGGAAAAEGFSGGAEG